MRHDRVVIIAEASHISLSFIRDALGLDVDDEYIIITDGSDRLLHGMDPERTTLYYLWMRPTPLHRPFGPLLDWAKHVGFRPIIVTDW